MAELPSLSKPKDHRAAVEAAVEVLAATIACAPPANVAALVGRYLDAVHTLAELDAAVEVNPIDELANKREKRRSKVPDPAAERGRKRGAGGG